jgi:hypothetical protein
MSRSHHSTYEVLDRSSGTRYRVDADEHPRDLMQVLTKSGRYVVRPILVHDIERLRPSGEALRELRISSPGTIGIGDAENDHQLHAVGPVRPTPAAGRPGDARGTAGRRAMEPG